MTKNTAVLNRQALALFNFWSASKNKNKRIGDLTIADFFEICKLLEEIKNASN
jgi:hypothetical protein